MMKWFRKHNKQLLAVFASALLVIWLGGTAFQRMFERDRFAETLGTAMGHKMTAAQSGALKTKLAVMESLGLPWYMPWFNPAVSQQLQVQDREAQMLMMTLAQPLNRDKGGTDWWLLDLEAQKMGITVSQQQVEEFLRQKHATAPDLIKIRDRFNMPTDELFDAVAEYLRVTQAAVLASAGVQVTEPQVKDLFVKTHDQIGIRYAILPADAFDNGTQTQPADEAVPEAELQALFDKYRDQIAGTGEYGFGYKIPDREVIQYAGGSVQDIANGLPAVPDDRARKYFEQHKAEFEPQRPASSQPTSQPAVTFEEVKEKVIDRMKKQEAVQLLTRNIEDVRTKAWEEFSGAKAALADNQVPPTLTKVMEQRTAEVKQAKRLPLVYKQIGPASQEQVRKEPGIGITGMPGAEGQHVEFSAIAFNLSKGDDNAKDQESRREEKSLQINRYQPVVVRSQSGDQLTSQYVFRVISFEPAHAPAGLAEARSQVERDARTLRALKKAEAAARQLAQAAEKDTLRDAFNAQFATAATQPATTQPSGKGMKMLEQPALTRAQYYPAQSVLQYEAMRKMYNMNMPGAPTGLATPARLAGLPNPEPVIKACFDLVGPATSTQPVNKVTVVELPGQKAWVVAQVFEHSPAKESDFSSSRTMIAGDIRLLGLRDFYSNWYKPQQIRERTGWKSALQMEQQPLE